MFKNRLLLIILIVSMWFSTTGFRALPNPAIGPENDIDSAAPAAAEPALLAAVTFGKIEPANGAVDQATSGLTLSWNAVTGVSGVTYRYCLLTQNKKCPAGKWISTGSKTSVTVNNLLPGKKYYWSVRAYQDKRTVIATADGANWSFTTAQVPGSPNKVSPAINATGQVVTGLVLSWSTASLATSYEYCVDSMYNTTCEDTWVNVGNTTTATVAKTLTNNTRYYWQVRAVNVGGKTEANSGAWWSFTTIMLPGLFQKVSPANGTADAVITGQTLNWMLSQGATSYDYCLSQTNGSCPSWTSAGSSTYATLPPLNYSTTYYWQARATSSGSPVEASGGWWSFTTQVPPPTTFNKISPANGAIAVSADPTLTWDASTGSGITYEYCVYDPAIDVPCASNEWIPATGTLSTDVLGLDAGTTYNWQVRAVNGTGPTESTGGWWSFTTEALPSTFNKVSPTSGTGVSRTPTLTWSASTGTNITYQVCFDTSNDNLCDSGLWSAETTSLSFSPTGLSNATTYYWQVRAQNSGGEVLADGDTSNWWSFTTPMLPPAAFQKSTPTNLASLVPTSQTLNWVVNDPAATYQYCLDTVDNSQCDLPAQGGTGWVTASSGVNPTLAYATTYYWQVRATNNQGTTLADGGWWSFTTIKAPPDAFQKSLPGNTAKNVPLNQALTWGSSSLGVTYQYCLDTVDNGQCDLPTQGGTGWVTASSGVQPALAENTTYYWQVRALNDQNTITEAGGVWWSFTTLLNPPASFQKISPINTLKDVPLNQALTWGISSQGAAFEYCLDTINNSQCDLPAQGGSGWVPASSGVTPTLAYATTYYWQVRAINAAGATEADGGWWSFTTQPIPLPAAFLKTAPVDTAKDVPVTQALTWEEKEAGVTYQYCLDPDTNGACDTGWMNATSGIKPALNYGTTYSWQVQATNGGGTTAASGGWYTFTTQIAPPAAFVKNAPANGLLGVSISQALTWEEKDANLAFQYCLDADTNGQCDSGWQDASSGVKPVLQYATTYSWQVHATNSTGPTEAGGGWWTFTTVSAAFPPVSANQTFDFNEDITPFTGKLTYSGGQPGATVTFTETGPEPSGAFSLASDGNFSYTPAANYNGTVTFQFTVSDGVNPDSKAYTATLIIHPQNDDPALAPIQKLSVFSATTTTFTAQTSDADLPNDILVYSSADLPSGATLDANTGRFSWMPIWSLKQPNTYTFTITVTDLAGKKSSQQVEITVLPRMIVLPCVLR